MVREASTERRRGGVVIAAGLLLVGWGCSVPNPPTGRTAALVAVEDGERFDALWDATTRVLRGNRFEPVWEDRAGGVITTRPVTAQHWFEWWRRDVADGYSFLEGNLHTIRRTASVKMDRSEEPDMYIVSVRVDEQRLRTPERQVTSPAGAIRMFSSMMPTTEGKMISTREAMSWIPLGRDGNLESRLLAQVIRTYRPVRYEYVEVVDADTSETPAESGEP